MRETVVTLGGGEDRCDAPVPVTLRAGSRAATDPARWSILWSNEFT